MDKQQNYSGQIPDEKGTDGRTSSGTPFEGQSGVRLKREIIRNSVYTTIFLVLTILAGYYFISQDLKHSEYFLFLYIPVLPLFGLYHHLEKLMKQLREIGIIGSGEGQPEGSILGTKGHSEQRRTAGYFMLRFFALLSKFLRVESTQREWSTEKKRKITLKKTVVLTAVFTILTVSMSYWMYGGIVEAVGYLAMVLFPFVLGMYLMSWTLIYLLTEKKNWVFLVEVLAAVGLPVGLHFYLPWINSMPPGGSWGIFDRAVLSAFFSNVAIHLGSYYIVFGLIFGFILQMVYVPKRARFVPFWLIAVFGGIGCIFLTIWIPPPPGMPGKDYFNGLYAAECIAGYTGGFLAGLLKKRMDHGIN